MTFITEQSIVNFEKTMEHNERAEATIQKYGSILRKLKEFLGSENLSKEKIIEYRDHLLKSRKPQTVNGALGAINSYLSYRGMENMQIKFLKVQRQAFLDDSKELSEKEYKRLLCSARRTGNERLFLLLMTVCSTGIRISELQYISVEAAQKGRAYIFMKGKCRTILLQKGLCNKLLQYAQRRKITEGHIFRTRNGKPMDRSNIWHEMKKLCDDAQVPQKKVFPHNLRHLFARTFYNIEKDLAHLADVLGHCRIETTRIYVAVSASSHERTLNKMHLVL